MSEMGSATKYRRISLLLFSISLVMAAVSIAFAELRFGTFGLMDSLPPTFFVALFLLALSFLVTVKFDGKNRIYLFTHIIALVVLLYLLPALVEKTARFAPSYDVYASTEYVLQHGKLEPAFSVYMKWPAITLLGASLSEVAQFSPAALLTGFPIVFELIGIPILYSILNSMLKNKTMVWIGLWLYFVAGWINRAYYSGQAQGYFLFLVILFVILYFVLRNVKTITAGRVVIPGLLIVLFLAIALSHLLSSIVAAISIVILYILFKLFKIEGTQRFSFLIPVFLVAIVVWVFLYNGVGFFREILEGPSGSRELFNFVAIFRSTFVVPFSAGAEHTTVMVFRAIYTGAFYTLALLGVLYLLVRRNMDLNSKLMLGLLIGAGSIVVLVGSYGGEIVYRAFEFSLLFLAFFAAKGFHSRITSIPLVVFLIVSPVIFVAAAYANEKADYISPAEINGVDFFYNYTTSDSTIHSLAERIWRSKDVKRARWRPLQLETVCVSEEGGYALLGERDIDTRVFLGGDLGMNTEGIREIFESSCRIHFYSSDGFDLYKEGISDT